MMEAQSFGIPIIACAVGGIPEIVGESTGILVDGRADIGEFAEALGAALEPGRFVRESVRAFSASNFDAKINYNRFADALIALWKDQAPAA
jgi:glycosyltransferase involved in cell wall biosynthesis